MAKTARTSTAAPADESQTHALVRTSPKGERFLGTCTLCGTQNLPMSAAYEPCPNQRGLSQDEALIDVIDGSSGAPTEYSDEDMATVGRSLMAAIDIHTATAVPGDPLYRWGPALCPSEVVGDLVEMVRQARAEQEKTKPSPEVPEPVYNAVERILDEKSAWVARPNSEVTMAIAMAATIAAMDEVEKLFDAERERCAQIADDYDQSPGDDTPMGPLMAAQVAIAQAIAAKIREGA